MTPALALPRALFLEPFDMRRVNPLRRALARVALVLVRVHDKVAVWHERRAERRALMGLDAAALKDLGLGRGDAYREFVKPFWRP
ncbi:MAG TPA: DUF1127 domain-containing protein [Alphaproteobacteria bacterium]|nr:DUF1127 domain-containing protein [Alphaproteobacteria bacterium]